MFYFSNARSFTSIVFSLWSDLEPSFARYVAAPGWEVGNPVAGQWLSFCPARPSPFLFSRRGVEGTLCSSFAHGPMLLLLDSDSCKSPLQNEGVRVFANFLYNIYIRLQIKFHFYILFRNALICLGRQESEGNNFNNFARTCEDLDVCILEITEVQAADILVTLQLQKREDPALGSSATTCIKAIRWVRRNTQCCVFEVFFGELISSFLRSKLPKDRCESVPLPLFALVQWERRILQRNTPVVDVILLGAILITVWASLRFSDSQRVEWSSFAFDIVSLRGVAYQTKVSHQGQPFGLITAGFLHHGSHSWVAKWLRVLDSVASSEVRDFGVAPSFLFPALDERAELIRPLSPMSYASCLKWLRYYLQFPWLDCPPDLPVSNYTVHSMKCSLLSYMLEVPSILGPDKDAQGHHRGSSRELYSRDDVLGALRAQQQLRAAVLAGCGPARRSTEARNCRCNPFRCPLSPSARILVRFDVSHSGSLPWTPEQAASLPAVAPPALTATSVQQTRAPSRFVISYIFRSNRTGRLVC